MQTQIHTNAYNNKYYNTHTYKHTRKHKCLGFGIMLIPKYKTDIQVKTHKLTHIHIQTYKNTNT